MSIWEMNDRLNHKNPHHLGFRDLIWQFFNDEPPCTPYYIITSFQTFAAYSKHIFPAFLPRKNPMTDFIDFVA